VPDDARPLLPELARSLRTLGRPDDAATEAAHAVVFVPLLDARAVAGRGDAADAIAALRGAALAARIESLARAAAGAGQLEAARARARAAASREVLEPLRAALAALDALAPAALGAGAHSPEWGRWIDQLRRVFSAADAACQELAAVLGERFDEPAAPGRGWFRRRSGPAR
jgi:hypothetical protein